MLRQLLFERRAPGYQLEAETILDPGNALG
jgi:hypothetical protein